MIIDLITYSIAGYEIIKNIRENYTEAECRLHVFERYADENCNSFTKAKNIVAEAFFNKHALIFVCATGIAVRNIAEHVSSKHTDSPVVVIDDGGKFSIALLSGHEGRANEIAANCAKFIGAVPVITTSTDVHEKFAVDVFAKKNNMYITDYAMAKEISVRMLAGKEVGIWLDSNYSLSNEILQNFSDNIENSKNAEYGIMITPFETKDIYKQTLRLIPRSIVLGIGCRKDIAYENVENAINEFLIQNNILKEAIKCICSIDIKAKEKAIIEYCENNGLEFTTYTAEELNEVTGDSATSEFVKNITGVDNVCEKSAIRGDFGQLLVNKTIYPGVTLAAAISRKEFT